MNPAATRLRLPDGTVLETRRVEPASRPDVPTLVLLHEGLGCVALWREFPERLSEATGCPVFLYSRAGYGASSPRELPWPLDYMQREGMHGLPAVLDAAEIGPCVLIGHSDGASIALVNAGGLADPRVRGVVVIAPHVFTEPMGLASIRAARDAYETGDLRARLARYHGDNIECAFRGWSDSWLHPDFARWNLQPYLPGIKVPLLQIQGKEDQYGSEAQLTAIACLAGGPVSTCLLEACRHAPHFERPAQTLSLIAEFVSGLTSDAAAPAAFS